MILVPGQSLLHFRLVEKVGEGGMGEVWRAVDTTLDREVAIKVLPASLARDPERTLRLEREAKLLASLNHPNIAAIYGFPEAGAPDANNMRFLTMELVRGEDLEQVLARGPLRINDALDAARQIAAALEAAHDRGVIHRDLKPANVKRTPDGQIKVLDFGLAKALETANPESTQSATVTSAGTIAGMILGTPSYMSPEQARGQAVDRRTDIWAFGCLLYEMLSGRKAFGGATITDVLAAVVTGEPGWDKLPAATPASARHLLRRCLEKDPRKRLRDAGDASLLLDDPEDEQIEPVPPARPARRPLLAAIALVAIVGAAVAGYGLAHNRSGVAEVSGVTFQGITFARGMMRSARFAPDGQTIVYGAAWDGPPIKLFLARADSPDATPINLPPGELLSISRTGEIALGLGYAYTGWMGAGKLARAPLLGGSPREILEGVRSADWSPDGSQMAIVRRVDGVDRLEYPAGTVLYSTAGYIADVRVSPDGRMIAFTDHPVYADDLGDLAVVDLTGHKTTLLAGLGSVHGAVWGPHGKEVWSSARDPTGGTTLFAADLAGRFRTVYRSISPIELFDIAADGRMLLGSHKVDRQSQALLAGSDEVRNLIVPGESSMARALARDGRAVLVTSQLSREYDTYVLRSGKPGAVWVSKGDGLAISPDGNWGLATSADLKSLYLSPLGMGETRTVPNPEGIDFEGVPSWFPDGKRIVFISRRGTGDQRAYTLDVETGVTRAFGDLGVFWDYFGQIPVSPDGKFVVLQNRDGRVLRWPVDGGPGLPIPGIGPGDTPLAWSDDGEALYVSGNTIPMPIVRLDLSTGRRTPWMTIAPSDAAGLRLATATITPNGKYWSLSVAKLYTELYVVDGLR